MFIFAILLLLAVATAAPTPLTKSELATCHAKLFNKSWVVSNITVFQPEEGSTDPGTINFHFRDINDRLGMGTNCSGTVVDGMCDGGDGAYVVCEDTRVAFKLAKDLMMVERAFLDECLGDFPYNSGIAFGQNNTKMDVVPTESGGKLFVQDRMLMPIIYMS